MLTRGSLPTIKTFMVAQREVSGDRGIYTPVPAQAWPNGVKAFRDQASVKPDRKLDPIEKNISLTRLLPDMPEKLLLA